MSDNEFRKSLDLNTRVTVHIPDRIDIHLVDARTFSDLEVWASLTSVLVSVAGGFLVAVWEDPASWTVLANFLFFCLLTLFCLGRTVWLRMTLFKNVRQPPNNPETEPSK